MTFSESLMVREIQASQEEAVCHLFRLMSPRCHQILPNFGHNFEVIAQIRILLFRKDKEGTVKPLHSRVFEFVEFAEDIS